MAHQQMSQAPIIIRVGHPSPLPTVKPTEGGDKCGTLEVRHTGTSLGRDAGRWAVGGDSAVPHMGGCGAGCEGMHPAAHLGNSCKARP